MLTPSQTEVIIKARLFNAIFRYQLYQIYDTELHSHAIVYAHIRTNQLFKQLHLKVEEKDIFDVEVSGSFDKVIHSLLFVCIRVMRKYHMEKANEKSVKDLCIKFGESLYKLIKVEGNEKIN